MLASMIPPAAMLRQALQIAAIFLTTETTPACLDLNTQSSECVCAFLTHLPNMRDTKLILREPKKAPRPYRETMSDQIVVTMCGVRASSCLVPQLLLMKLRMNCVEKVQI